MGEGRAALAKHAPVCSVIAVVNIDAACRGAFAARIANSGETMKRGFYIGRFSRIITGAVGELNIWHEVERLLSV
jgi:hypothetical protein